MSTSSTPPAAAAASPKTKTYCQNCGKRRKDGIRLQNCGRCKLVAYCGKECQAANWKEHKTLCKQHQELMKGIAEMDLNGPPPPNPFPKLDIPPGTTTRKRAYEMDWENMTPADWSRVKEINKRIDLLNNAYSIPDGLAGVRPKKGPCQDLKKDIDKHWDDYWYPEVFHPECGDREPCNCERAVICLKQLVLYYHQGTDEVKCQSAYDTYMRVLECLGKIIQEGLFRPSQELKDRYERYPRTYPGVHGPDCSCARTNG